MTQVYHSPSEDGTTKICSACLSEVSLTDFYKNSHGGYQSRCKTCYNLPAKLLTQEKKLQKQLIKDVFNPANCYQIAFSGLFKTCSHCLQEKVAEQFYNRSTTCKACTSKRQKDRYVSNPEYWTQRNRKDYLAQRDERKKKQNERYYADLELHRKNSRDYREKHLEESMLRNKEYTKAHHVERAEYMRRRHALKRTVQVADKVDYNHILERDDNWCYICEKDITPEQKIDFDHVIPLVRSGLHTEDNIRVTHSMCNRRKNRRLLSEMTLYQRRGL
jgi:HNH endonuclease